MFAHIVKKDSGKCRYIEGIQKMKFSIVIPVYNTSAYLRDCLQSVLQQNCRDWEAICVNDGSTDNSLQILNAYAKQDKRIRVLTQTNQGLSAARNAGINAAQGEWLFFLDSDDALASPHALQTLLEVVEKKIELLDSSSPSVDVIAFGSRLWYSEDADRSVPNDLFNHKETNLFPAGLDYLDYFVSTRGWGPSAACFYLWRTAFERLQNLTFPIGLLHEDEWFVPMALSKAGGVQTMQNVLYSYRLRYGSIAYGKQTRLRAINKLQIAQSLKQELTVPPDKQRIKKRLLYNLARNASHGLKALSGDWWKTKWLMLCNANGIKEYIRVIVG